MYEEDSFGVPSPVLICINPETGFLTNYGWSLTSGAPSLDRSKAMANKMSSLLVMGSISLILFTMLSFATIGQSYPGPVWLWNGLGGERGFDGVRATAGRNSAQRLSLPTIDRRHHQLCACTGDSLRSRFGIGTLSAQADWLRTIDFTPPIVARLREALASAYFAIGVFVLGAILFTAAYLLLHFRGPQQRHAH